MTPAAFPPESLRSFLDQLSSRYRLEHELGRGGMATVYYAVDLSSGRPVAIKVLLPELAASIGADRFLREIEVGRVLQHPGIVGVLDSGEVDGKLYYVMPFIDGASLRDRLDTERQLGIDDALGIIAQICEALDFAHARDVIHRDIKPENILLSNGRAMLADFGIARAVSVAGGDRLTRTGMAVGTPTYMSPEQAMGSHEVTPESDIYSLACVLYEMLAGQPPFTGPTAMALLARHSLDNVPSLKIVRSTVPDAVEDAITKALAKVPADRFHSGKDFVAALTDQAGAEARREQRLRTASREAIPEPPARSASRRRLLAAVVVVAVLAAGGLAAWTRRSRGAAGWPKSEIAVLYFEDRTPDGSLRYLSDGLTEALIQELGQVKTLHVVSRNGVAQFKGRPVAPDSVSRALQVGTVVTGTVQRANDSLRVNVSLIDPRTNKELSNTHFARPKSESFQLQDDLARQVSLFLRKRIGEVELQGKAGTESAEAYETFQRARQMIADADVLLAGGDARAASAQLLVADTTFANAEQLDPYWVAPVVQQGWLSYKQSRLLSVYDRPAYSKWIEDGLVHAARAIEIDPKNADALELRGTLHYWQWLLNIFTDPTGGSKLLADAEGDLNESVKLNPQQASAWNVLSHLRAAKSQTSEAKLAALKAYEVDPYLTDVNRTVWRLFQTSLDLNDQNEAQKWCDVGGKRFPDDFRFAECRLWLHTLVSTTKPTAKQIWASYDAYVKASPPNLQDLNKLKGGMLAAIALVRAGLPDSARAVAVRSRATPDVDPPRELTYLEAIVRAQLGDTNDAFRMLNVYLATNPQQRASTGEDQSWWFDKIKNDPRWEALKKG